MEEILASIRQIISEDGQPAASGEGARAEASATPEPADLEPESAPYETVVSRLESEPVPEPAPVIEPRQTHQETARPQPPLRALDPGGERERYDAPPQPRPSSLAMRPTPQEEESPLLSPEKSAAVSGAFGALTQTLLAQNSRTLEDVVAEMLQPMLKSWLDDNLPSLVERMVQEEIERVSRGRR